MPLAEQHEDRLVYVEHRLSDHGEALVRIESKTERIEYKIDAMLNKMDGLVELPERVKVLEDTHKSIKGTLANAWVVLGGAISIVLSDVVFHFLKGL